ncbi:hypothetical protein OV450_8381 [Actinobacteria bacterium OV450]|nr:hypothetical protein OV450_8381 [Actinobacteria bacterium OV450]
MIYIHFVRLEDHYRKRHEVAESCSDFPPPALFLLDEVDRMTVERELFAAYATRQPSLASDARRLSMCRALVYMRINGSDTYSPQALRERRNGGVVPQAMDARVRRTAYPEGTRVKITGERHLGIVVHVAVVLDSNSPYPAPWYIVLCPLLKVCRAHGAEEIESIQKK